MLLSLAVGGVAVAALLAADPLVSAARSLRSETARATPAPSPAPGATAPAAQAPAAAATAASGAPPRDAAPGAVPASHPRVSGRVVARGGTPLAGASVVAGGKEIRTDAGGAFAVDVSAEAPELLVKMPGYEKVRLAPPPGHVTVTLTPRAVKAAYLTYYGVADRAIRGRVLEAIARTELNAVVIDVKGDRGLIPYRTEVPLAAEIAQGPVIVRDFDGLLADLRARGVYTIARIVAFKDHPLAQRRPDLAVLDTRTGQPWVDRERLAWVDPFRREVWDYIIAVAKEAVRKGFDEIQFDYVRFPTDGKLTAARYAQPNTMETRLTAIAGFLERARAELGALGAFVAADIFGYTAFNENDTDIGQRVEELAPHVDYLSPMVYPSGYHVGIPRYRNPVAHPYEVVHESVRLIRKRSAHAVVAVRPWLQDFRDYAFDRRVFGVGQVRAQIRGSEDAGGVGWMLWNPRNDYTVAALRPAARVAAAP